MATLRARPSGVKVFLMSGISDSLRKDIGRKIHLLGGKYLDLQDFKSVCTHVICGRVSRSEKFLGACATGKWVLHPDYIHDSYIAGCWLDEEQYEWCDDHIIQKYNVDMTLAFAARRQRFLLGDVNLAFSGWKVAVIAGAKKSKVIKRLLISGGAEVFNIKLPVKNPAKVADTIGYIFIGPQYVQNVLQLIDYGVLCIKPEFIGDYIIMDPAPDPMDYLVQVSDVEELPVEGVDPLSQDSFLMESQRLSYTSPQRMPSSQGSDFTPLSSATSSASKVIPKSKLVRNLTEVIAKSEQPGPSHVVDVVKDISRRLKTEPMEDYVEVIDLTNDETDTDDNSTSTMVERNNTEEFSKIEIKTENVDTKSVRKSRRELVKKSPAWKGLIPGRRKSVNVSTDDQIQNYVEPAKNKEVLNNYKYRSDLIGAERFSFTPDEDTNTDETNESTVENSASGHQQDSAVRRNLAEQLSEGKTSVTSTPQGKTMSKKNLMLASLNMSPITKFFKRIERSSETVKSHLNKSDNQIPTTSTSAMKTEIRLNQSEIIDAARASDNLKTDSDTSELIYKPGDTRVKVVGNVNRFAKLKETDSKREMDEPVVSEYKKLKNKSKKKHPPDNRGDRKRKSADAEVSDDIGDELIPCKRVTRSAPTNSDENLPERTPEKKPDINDFTTIYISPSKKTSGRKYSQFSQEFERSSKISSGTERSFLVSQETESCSKWTQSTERHSQLSEEAPYYAAEETVQRGSRKREADNHIDLKRVIVAVKKKKVGFCEWCPSMFAVDLRMNEAVPESFGMTKTSTEMFLIMLEDGFTYFALNYLQSTISFKYYPQSKVISEVLRNILLTTEDELLANMSYNILSQMLMLHPPSTPALQDVYIRGLAGWEEGQEWQVGAEWDFIYQCLSNILASDNTVSQRNNVLVFRFILQLLQQNLQHLSVSQSNCDTRHLLLRIIWCPSYHVVFNRRCRALVETMSDFIQTCQAKACDQEKSVLLEVLDGVLWMVAMITDCCRHLECGNINQIQALYAPSTSAFVHEISRKLIELDVRDPVLLENIFSGLLLPWLRVGVCQKILNTYDDYLVTDDLAQDSRSISLLLIVTKYMYLLPMFDVRPKSLSSNSPARKRTKGTTQDHSAPTSKCLTENKSDLNNVNIHVQKNTLKVNKRNPKGETPLHVACIRNDVVAVKQLLKVPGIDVNATDNVGWTPLHEACNHGNSECVRELLKFVPSKTMDTFFSKETVCKKVDLFAANGEGITPLHDAVTNNRLEVCHLLLQHGGPKLLEPVTIQGYTPLDFAESDDMASLLLSYSEIKRHDDSMNLTGSQGAISDTDEIIPDVRYEQCIYLDEQRIFVSAKSASHFIQLITLIVKNYILMYQNIIDEIRQHSSSSQEMDMYDSIEDTSRSQTGSQNVLVTCRYCDNQMNQRKSKSCECSISNFEGSQSSGYTCSTITSGRTEQNRVMSPDTSISYKEVESIKKDIKILRRMSHFVKSFKNHLFKICQPEDLSVIEKKLQELYFVTEISGL